MAGRMAKKRNYLGKGYDRRSNRLDDRVTDGARRLSGKLSG